MNKKRAIDYLLEAARWAPSADNSQPWQVTRGQDWLAVQYATARVRETTFPAEDPATLLAMGAVLENLTQAAASAGITVSQCNAAPGEYFRLALSNSMQTVSTDPNHDLFRRHTNRLPYRKASLPEALKQTLAAMTEGGAYSRILIGRAEIGSVARLVKHASELRFRTREINEWLGRSLRFSPKEAAKGDGLDLETLHVPPGGRSLLRLLSDARRLEFLNHLGAYKLLAAIEAQPIMNASAIFAIIAPGGVRSAMDAGRLMERIWIELNRNGLAVQPYYVVADQLFRRDQAKLPPDMGKRGNALAREVEDVFELAGNKLYMLLRVGFPKTAPTRSQRLPLRITSPD